MTFLKGPLMYALVAIVAVGIAIYSFRLPFNFTDINKSPYTNNNRCRKISGIGASEDVVADETTGMVYLGTGTHDGRTVFHPGCNFAEKNHHDNSIYRDKVMMLNTATEALTELKIEGYEGQDFVSHGMAMLPSEDKNDNSNYLFFVNHKRTGSVISVFKHQKGTSAVQFQHEFKHPGIKTPNSVAPISPFEVYVTNDHYFKARALKMVEAILGPFPITNVVRCTVNPAHPTKGASCTSVLSGLAYANGIEFLRGRNELAVAETMAGRVNFLPRDPVTGALDVSNKRSVNLGIAVDNIRRVPATAGGMTSDDLVVASFPDPFVTLDSLVHPVTFNKTVAAMAVYLRASDNYLRPLVAFHDKAGAGLNTLTGYTMVPSKRKLVAGSVMYDGLVVCDVDYDFLK